MATYLPKTARTATACLDCEAWQTALHPRQGRSARHTGHRTPSSAINPPSWGQSAVCENPESRFSTQGPVRLNWYFTIADGGERRACSRLIDACAILMIPVLATVTGCNFASFSTTHGNEVLSISSGPTSPDARSVRMNSIDTNCTGCNSIDSRGRSVEQFTANLSNGNAAPVVWSLSGGDAVGGPGSITSTGQFTPPSFLTEDSVLVLVTASLENDPSIRATTSLQVTPGFRQPLAPENAAVGGNGAVNITAYLSEAGGSTGIEFDVRSSPRGEGAGLGTLSSTVCERGNQAFTSCTATYTAPPLPNTGTTYVVARIGASSTSETTRILLNNQGVSSNPLSHQAQSMGPLELGSSGGNNNDYDLAHGQIVDCCSGTLGSLLQSSDNKRYLLSNNHVLARSDQANVGDPIVQPGLIDNNCTSIVQGTGINQVGTLTGWLPLISNSTNADAALAEVRPDAVDQAGSILEMGARQPDGTLAAAPPGISSSGGKGETGVLQMKVAKSGRTTGQTCASITAVDLDVTVNYYLDCGESKPYLTKTFTSQLLISGDNFGDAGDSGSLVVDAGNAEPVGLFFAGGIDTSGVSQIVASPVTDVLSELSRQVGDKPLAFVGTADHPVSCLNFGDSTVELAQRRELSDGEVKRAQQALSQARALVNPAAGIIGVSTGKSNDSPGEAAILVYVNGNVDANVPASIGGVRSMVIPSSAGALALGSVPQSNSISASRALPDSLIDGALQIKRQYASTLMKSNPAFFAVGVGQSLDDPRRPAMVIYVDRRIIPPELPQSVGGLRTRYIVMDPLHVTRSYAQPVRSESHCKAHPQESSTPQFDRSRSITLQDLAP